MEIKKDIRKRILRQRQMLSEEEQKAYSLRVASRVTAHPLFLRAEDIFCYLPVKGEVDTSAILQTAWKQGKRTAVPKVISKTEMQFYYINSYEELREGTYGILEPITGRLAEPHTALVILPGTVFDIQCNRIGYGGGYYDRYLAAHRSYRTMALAYSVQIVPELPKEDHDIPVEYLITESEEYHRNGI